MRYSNYSTISFVDTRPLKAPAMLSFFTKRHFLRWALTNEEMLYRLNFLNFFTITSSRVSVIRTDILSTDRKYTI